VVAGGGAELDAAQIFRRGDANTSGTIDISDAVFGLNHLFSGGPEPHCAKTADANDDGLINISDASYLLNHLFVGGPPPPTPFPDCDSDPTADSLTCVVYASCRQPAPRDPREYLEEVAAAGDSPELDPTCSLWEVDAAGQMMTIAICEDSVRSEPGEPAYRGAIRFDTSGKVETLPAVTIRRAAISFEEPVFRRLFIGTTGPDLILGTWSSLQGPGDSGSWRARPATSTQGLAELGDSNGDGRANNQDIVDFVASLGITLHTYQVCDDDANPACFDLLAEPATTSPDGMVKTFAPDRFRDFAVSPTPFPPARLPGIRNLGRSCLAFPREMLATALQGQGWTFSFAGLSGPRETLTHQYEGSIVNTRVLFLFASLRPSGRLYLDGTGVWDVIEDVAVAEDRLGVLRLRFSRRLPGGGSQAYTGAISGPATKGVLGTSIAGTFTEGATTLRWSAEGVVPAPGAGVSTLDLVHDGATGRLRLRLDDGWMGRLKISGQPVDFAEFYYEHPDWWEPLEQVEFDGTQLTFRRTGVDLVFTGLVADGVVKGSVAGSVWEAFHLPVIDLAEVEPGCHSRPDWNVGTICKQAQLIAACSQTTCLGALAYPLHAALNPPAGPPRSPFDQAALDAFNQASFSGSRDFAYAVANYAASRSSLWRRAREELALGFDASWKRLEFVRRWVFGDAGIAGRWTVDLAGERGLLEIDFDKTRQPTGLLASFTPPRRPPETLAKVLFDGSTLQFLRVDPGPGFGQSFIGELRGSELRGFFVSNGETQEWVAHKLEP
jgi:hypothetical protein